MSKSVGAKKNHSDRQSTESEAAVTMTCGECGQEVGPAHGEPEPHHEWCSFLGESPAPQVSLNAHEAPTVEDATGSGGEAAHGLQHGPDEGCLQCDAYRNGLTHGIYERGYSEGFRAGEESVKTGGQYSEGFDRGFAAAEKDFRTEPGRNYSTGFDRGFAEAEKEWKDRMGKIWDALAPFFDEDAMGQIHVTGKVVMVDGEEFDLREVFGG